MSVIWHDLECGAYTADIPLWLELADRHPGPVLDIGAGTGRTTLALARAGHDVTALDNDPELLAELRRRAGGLPVEVVLADAREFDLGRRFAVVLVPMQTIQLLGGAPGRARFLRTVRRHLEPNGILTAAVSEELELFEVSGSGPSPLPDVCECDGIVYASRPTAVRADGDEFVLERQREVVSAAGELSSEVDRVRLDRLGAEELEREAADAGLRPQERRIIPPTPEHVGSVVVVLGA
jgi:SAM-dependent methyltransferase